MAASKPDCLCRNCHKRPARTHYSNLSLSMVCWTCHRNLTRPAPPPSKPLSAGDPFAIFDEPSV